MLEHEELFKDKGRKNRHPELPIGSRMFLLLSFSHSCWKDVEKSCTPFLETHLQDVVGPASSVSDDHLFNKYRRHRVPFNQMVHPYFFHKVKLMNRVYRVRHLHHFFPRCCGKHSSTLVRGLNRDLNHFRLNPLPGFDRK